MILNQPFPRNTSFSRSCINAVSSGVIVTLFLRVFQPFGFGQAPVSNLNLFAAGYGIITVLTVFAFAGFEKIFPSWFLENKWTVGKNILLYLLIIFFIGSFNFVYTVFTARMPLNMEAFFSFQIYTLFVTFIVVAAITMFKYFRLVNYYRSEGEKVEQEVLKIKQPSGSAELIFKSENEKDTLQIPLKALLYIEATDNYCKFIFKKDNKLAISILRSSMKKIEDQIKHSELFRCHRTYIVQLKNVKRVSGNSQGYRLHFENFTESVPVSRKLNREIHERILVLNYELPITN
jgi:hypothetical protein